MDATQLGSEDSLAAVLPPTLRAVRVLNLARVLRPLLNTPCDKELVTLKHRADSSDRNAFPVLAKIRLLLVCGLGPDSVFCTNAKEIQATQVGVKTASVCAELGSGSHWK